MSKLAVIVVGPESSGTRLLTKLFIDVGFDGDGGHEQRFDNENPTADKVVFRRSFPHRKKWPQLHDIRTRFRNLGYEVKVVVILRSWSFTYQSVVYQEHTASYDKAKNRAREAFKRIGGQLIDFKSKDVLWTTYEALVNYPQAEVDNIFGEFGLDSPDASGIYDGNEKYV